MDLLATGILLRKQRIKNNLTREQLEKMFNLAPGSVKQLETGDVEEIGVRLLSRICFRLGIEIEAKKTKMPTLQELYAINEKEKAKILKANSIKINRLFQPPSKNKRK
jgi:transcriptional regulator with XRE-family HTH domain